MSRKTYIDNIPLKQAWDLFLDELESNGYFKFQKEVVPVLDAQNRVTFAAVYARRSSPHYVASAMDGIAVQASSTYAATETNPITLPTGAYLEVDTGDYVPRQYDSVIMIEEVDFTPDGARIIKPAVPWQHIRSVGEDLVAHDMLLPSHTLIGPYEVASLLAAAVSTVEVIKQPVVVIIPTGTELRDQGYEDMAPGEIVDSNSRMLAGLCWEWGAIPRRHPIVIDDKNLLKDAIVKIKDEADMIVVCSGSSAGREDYTSTIVENLGKLIVHGIATRPGKPAILGIVDGKPIIGVPGYPVSAQLIFNLFARPILYRKQSRIMAKPDIMECQISRKLASSMGVDEFVYVNVAPVKNVYKAYPLSRGAGITTSLVKADGFIQIKNGYEGLEAGESCQVILQRPRKIIEKTLIAIGSHDLTMDFLADLLWQQYRIRLVSNNTGSMGGIMSLKKQETHFSGIHLLDHSSGEYNITYLNKYLGGKWLLVNLVKRQQGLMVKKGNPLKIKNLKDLAQSDIRFINRQKGSGTRVLLDYLLHQQGINTTGINGYNREEYTHLAVAASVKNDACDAGLGIYASARALDLDFIPVAEERYDLCILPDLMPDNLINLLIDIIRSPQLATLINQAGGYNLDLTGQIMAESES
ncbi:molybdopterin biosynthesis protein [Syntrophomonas erecta]